MVVTRALACVPVTQWDVCPCGSCQDCWSPTLAWGCPLVLGELRARAPGARLCCGVRLPSACAVGPHVVCETIIVSYLGVTHWGMYGFLLKE